MTQQPIVLNFVAGVADVPDTDPEALDGWTTEVPALYINGTLVWTAPANTYFDQWGDGGDTAADVVIEHLKERLA